MMKKLFSTCLFTLFALFASQTHAVLIKQDLSLSGVVADAGNAFGLLDGFSGIIGYVSYDSTDENAVNWGFVDLTGANPTLDIEIVLGGLTFTEDMDADTPNYPFGELNDLLDPLSGISYLEALLEDAFGNSIEFDSFGLFTATDGQGLSLFGDLALGEATVVPVPATIALFSLGLCLLGAQRRQMAA